MLPIVLQEDSVVSIQCLMLLGIYFACRMQPRQSYEYIRIASFRMQSLLRRYVSHLSNYEGKGKIYTSYVANLLPEKHFQRCLLIPN